VVHKTFQADLEILHAFGQHLVGYLPASDHSNKFGTGHQQMSGKGVRPTLDGAVAVKSILDDEVTRVSEDVVSELVRCGEPQVPQR